MPKDHGHQEDITDKESKIRLASAQGEKRAGVEN